MTLGLWLAACAPPVIGLGVLLGLGREPLRTGEGLMIIASGFFWGWVLVALVLFLVGPNAYGLVLGGGMLTAAAGYWRGLRRCRWPTLPGSRWGLALLIVLTLVTGWKFSLMIGELAVPPAVSVGCLGGLGRQGESLVLCGRYRSVSRTGFVGGR